MDTRDHSGATARMLAKQYGHMKIVGLIDAHSPSLPKNLYRSPGTCFCTAVFSVEFCWERTTPLPAPTCPWEFWLPQPCQEAPLCSRG